MGGGVGRGLPSVQENQELHGINGIHLSPHACYTQSCCIGFLSLQWNETTGCWAVQELPFLRWNSKVWQSAQKPDPLYPNPQQFHQFGSVTTFLKIRLILSFYLRPGLPSGVSLSCIRSKSLCASYTAVLTIRRDNCDEILRRDKVKPVITTDEKPCKCHVRS